jgi:hypothetical protein
VAAIIVVYLVSNGKKKKVRSEGRKLGVRREELGVKNEE